MSHALELIRAELASGKTLQQVGREIGYSRPTVSLYNSGKYPSEVEAIEAAIVKAYDRRLCPHIAELIEPAVCSRKALSPKPFGGSDRLAWWKCCQHCPNKPELNKE